MKEVKEEHSKFSHLNKTKIQAMEMVELIVMMMMMMMVMVMVMIRMLISKVFVLALRDIRRCPRLKFRHWRHHTEHIGCEQQEEEEEEERSRNFTEIDFWEF